MAQRKVQSSAEMALDMEQKKPENKLYKAMTDAHKGEMLEADISFKRELLKTVFERGRVNLSNADEVQALTLEYMDACQMAKTFPTVMGLATALGISRQRLNRYIAENENDTTRFLETVKDVFADIMSNAALFRNSDAATTIFILKNCAGFADRIEIEPVIHNEQSADAQTLVAAAKMLPDNDNE